MIQVDVAKMIACVAEVKIPDSCKGWVTGTLAKMEPKIRKQITRQTMTAGFIQPPRQPWERAATHGAGLELKNACCFLLAHEHPKTGTGRVFTEMKVVD